MLLNLNDKSIHDEEWGLGSHISSKFHEHVVINNSIGIDWLLFA
jgi:hypothetical protein